MPVPPLQNKNQAGVTIVEMMIAMVILALGILAATSMQIGTARNNSNGNIRTQAHMLAVEQLEILKNQNVSFLIPGTYSDASQIDANGQPGGIYTRNWTIANLGTGGRILTVTVQWQRGEKSNRVVLSSNTRGNGV